MRESRIQPLKFHRRNRSTERAGVNACRAFFEKYGCVFVEIGLENDYGKDAYLDLGDSVAPTSICAALQIKSGKSFRRGDEYQIPLSAKDFKYWRDSTVPVIGIVFDPEDGLLRWVNISQYLHSANPGTTKVPVSKEEVLTDGSVLSRLRDSIRAVGSAGSRNPLVQLCDANTEVQVEGVHACFALGRSEARLLVGLRRLLFTLSPTVIPWAITALAHLTPHPDIFWQKSNWIPNSIKRHVTPELTWKVDELMQFFLLVSPENWERGGLGQSVYMLMIQDPELDYKLELAVIELAKNSIDEAAFALLVLISRIEVDGSSVLQRLKTKVPALSKHDFVTAIAETLNDYGSISLW